MTSKQFEQLPRSKQLERFDRYKKSGYLRQQITA